MSSDTASRTQTKGLMLVHTIRMMILVARRTNRGLLTSNAVTLIRLKAGLLKILFTLHILLNSAANTKVKP